MQTAWTSTCLTRLPVKSVLLGAAWYDETDDLHVQDQLGIGDHVNSPGVLDYCMLSLRSISFLRAVGCFD